MNGMISDTGWVLFSFGLVGCVFVCTEIMQQCH